MVSDLSKSAFFVLYDRPSGYLGYPHMAVLFAEGLRAMGWEISSNIRAWQEEPGGPYLFPGGGDEKAEGADLILIEDDYFQLQGHDSLPKLPAGARAAVIYLDRSDVGKATARNNLRSFRALDLILRCHSLELYRRQSNVVPTAIGITSRLAKATAPRGEERTEAAVWNFRHTKFAHNTRQWADRKIRPLLESRYKINRIQDTQSVEDTEYDRLMQAQTDRKHFPSYFRDLRTSIVCACFGGWFILPVRQTEASNFSLQTRALIRRLPIITGAVQQWDSFRLWETFAAGTAVLQFDMEKCGFLTGGPLPKPLEHYVPVSLSNPEKSLQPILEDRSLLLRIGAAGREWAFANYGPESIVRRALAPLGMREAG